MNIKLYLHVITLLAVLFAVSCKKDKQDSIAPSSENISKASSSNIRIFNFTDYDLDLTISNIPLTAYGTRDGSGGVVPGTGTTTQLGLQFFPKGAWKAASGGSPFVLPSSLLDKNGNTNLRISTPTKLIDTTMMNDPLQPKDYYLFRKFINGKDSFNIVTLNRVSNPPAQAQYFKIRILNSQQENDPLGLTGPVTLTYADGTPVNPKLSNIAAGASSEYVELPYGAYQFKLFATNGASIDVTKQFTEMPVQPDYQSNKPLPQPQQGCIIPVRTYKPGGAYTVMLSPAAMKYLDKYPDGGSDPANTIFNMNAYRLVTDIDPAVNFSFARVQAANALPGGKLTILIDGEVVGADLSFGESGGYKIITRGDHTISVVDAGGKKLTEKSLTIYPYDNYTIWAWQNKEGKPELLFSAVDMTGITFNYDPNLTSVVDGSQFLKLHPFAWSTRFINLSPDLPFATFANDQSLFIDFDNRNIGGTYQPSPAACNLAAGEIRAKDPFLVYAVGKSNLGQTNPAGSGQGAASRIRVFNSSGVYAELPGQLISQVDPIQVQQQFIANQALYTAPGTKPWAEGGIYTVALIGKINATAPAEKAKLILIKHNQ